MKESRMAKHVFLGLTSPVEGQEDEYNKWYNETHVPEILSVPGIVSARRFKTKLVVAPGAPAWKYICIFEVETDDLRATLKALEAATSAPVAALDASAAGQIVAKEIFSLHGSDIG
jgi:hypothetical protein